MQESEFDKDPDGLRNKDLYWLSIIIISDTSCKPINCFPDKPLFLCICSKYLLKTLGEKEQFLLFPSVFSNLLENSPPFSSNLQLSSTHSFILEEFEICCLGIS